MRLRTVCALAGVLALGGCLHAVTIPQQEFALKEACHGKDRILASRNGISIYRCGEGDQAKFVAYQNGTLYSEMNEIDAVTLASVGHCAGNGLVRGTPDFEACVRNTRQLTMTQGASLRQTENTAAEEKQRQAIVALAAIGSAAAAGAAAASQSTTQPTFSPVSPLQTPVRCNSQRLGNYINTNCF